MKSFLLGLTVIAGYFAIGLFVWPNLLTTTNFILVFGFAAVGQAISRVERKVDALTHPLPEQQKSDR